MYQLGDLWVRLRDSTVLRLCTPANKRVGREGRWLTGRFPGQNAMGFLRLGTILCFDLQDRFFGVFLARSKYTCICANP